MLKNITIYAITILMTPYQIERRGTSEILDPLEGENTLLQERWADKTLDDVRREMPIMNRVDISSGRSVEVPVLDAIGERDEVNVVLALPFLQGWTPHHYIRATTMQELLFPHSRVAVLTDEPDSVILSDEDRAKLAEGDGRPIAEQQMEALETLGLGTVAVTGYSRGGLTVAHLAEIGSDSLEIIGLNIDEPPSAAGRDEKALKKDFQDGGLGAILGLRSAVREAGIPALTQAMNGPRMAYDLARFGLRNLSQDAKLIRQTMVGSSNGLIQAAAEQVGPDRTKVGSVFRSPMYGHADLYTVQQQSPMRAVQYIGEGFHGHSSADNVIMHAGMVYDGFRE